MKMLPQKGAGRPDPVGFGRSLVSGLGINLLLQDIERSVRFLNQVFGFEIAYWDDDFALCHGFGAVFMLHHDRTYRNHPFKSSVAGIEMRGGGVELRIYGCDPDQAVKAMEAIDGEGAADVEVLDAPANKPHGVREAFILGPEGYVWVPTIPDLATTTELTSEQPIHG